MDKKYISVLAKEILIRLKRKNREQLEIYDEKLKKAFEQTKIYKIAVQYNEFMTGKSNVYDYYINLAKTQFEKSYSEKNKRPISERMNEQDIIHELNMELMRSEGEVDIDVMIEKMMKKFG
jgi:hypothetical protein